MNNKILILLLSITLFCSTAMATRNTVITSTLTNQVVCDPQTNFTIYGPNNGAARWQSTFDTTQTPGQILEFTAGINVTQSDSVVYYRRLSFDYSDTSNWYKVRYIPKPTVTNLASYTICSGANTQLTLTSSAPSTFTFTVVTTIAGTTGASSGSGSQINQVLINPNNSSNGGIVYRITPTAIDGGCAGVVKDITINVLPKTQISNLSTHSICSGSTLTIPLNANLPSTFSWTKFSQSSLVTGAKDSAGTSMVLNLFNSSNSANGTAVYSVLASSNAANCKSDTTKFTITVKPLPVISLVLGDTICSGLTNEQVYFQNSIFSSMIWNPLQSQGVTGAASGSGTVMRQSLINSSTTQYGNIQYAVTLTSVDGNCTNALLPLKIYVAPTPKVIGPTTKLICNGSNTNLIPTTDYPGSFFWTLGATTGNLSGAAASLQVKTGIFQTLTNNGTGMASQVYLVKHTLADAPCASVEKPITVFVSNTSHVLSTSDTFFYACSGKPLSDTIRSNPQASFYWKPLTNTQINGAIADSGVVFNQTLMVLSGRSAVQQFVLWPYLGTEGCSANPLTIKVDVRAKPSAGFTYTFSNDTFYFSPTDTSLSGYRWQFGDSSFSTQKKPKHVYTKTGSYMVSLQANDSIGCSQDSSAGVVYSRVGITEHIPNQTWTLYPNPANDVLYLPMLNSGQTYQLQIRDVLGRVYLSRQIQASREIIISDLAVGFYLVSITTPTLQITRPLLIKR